MKNDHLTLIDSPSVPKRPWHAWLLAARPQTWIASLAPVLMGGMLAPSRDPLLWTCTFCFALFLQIGANFANDLFDFLQGADTQERKGPKRAVQQRWISPKQMQVGTALVLGCALLFAIPCLLQAGWWSYPLALLATLCAIGYTAGTKSFGYLGLGEGVVFLFFGPVAFLGTYFLQTGEISTSALFASLAPGCLSSAILLSNNLRDAITDQKASKKTLVVRLGIPFGQTLYFFLFFSAFLSPLYLYKETLSPSWLLLGIFFPLLLWPYPSSLLRKKNFSALLPCTALFLALYTLLFCLCTLSTT